MTSQERRQARYERRMAKRQANKERRNEEVGKLEDVFTFHRLFRCGKDCCKGVRWKGSTQQFERHLLSNTAKTRKRILEQTWEPGNYFHFTLHERGKTRPIDAPRIIDRQAHKVYTRYVLLPLYRPSMIYNNGASLKGKGFDFAKEQLKKELHAHYRKYGLDGSVILLDFKKFFPSVPHDKVLKRHNELIQDDGLRWFGDIIIDRLDDDRGLPLGVEPSQAEMIGFPSPLDNYIKCQLSMKGAGHYMDDYYILVPPDKDAKEILRVIISKAESLGLTINRDKTKIVPISKPFRYCKAKYKLIETGKVIVTGSRDSIKRARRKIRALKKKIDDSEIGYLDLYRSVNASFAYLDSYNDHNRALKLRRYFYHLFGFSPEKYENFVQKEKERGVHHTSKV